jgi:hypothetical protein
MYPSNRQFHAGAFVTKMFWAAILFTTLAGSQENYDRTDKPFAAISKPIGELHIATGWALNQSQQWVSRKNRIPCTRSPELIDAESWGQGISNFSNMTLRTITLNDSEYDILIILYKSGYYRYPTIHQNWLPDRKEAFFVIEKNDINKFRSVSATPALIDLTALYAGEDIVVTSADGVQEAKKYLNKILADTLLQSMKHTISFNTLICKNSIRFTILSQIDANEMDMPGSGFYNSFGDLESIPGELENKDIGSPLMALLQPEIFHSHYFEASIVDFNALFPIVL